MAVNLHMEASGTSKNCDFVKDILKKRQIAQIVVEIAVMSPKTTPKTKPASRLRRRPPRLPKAALGAAESHHKNEERIILPKRPAAL